MTLVKKSLRVLLATSLLLVIVGCGESENAKEDLTSTQSVSGKSTLASAKVCLDTNANGLCDEQDVQSETDAAGLYTLSYDTDVKEGTLLIVEDGYNLVLEQNNNGRFRFVALLDKSDTPNNINTISSLITQLVQERSYTRYDAQRHLSESYNIALEDVLEDPIALAQANKTSLLLVIHGIEEGYTTRSVQKKSASRAATQTGYVTPTIDDADDFLSDGGYLDFDVGTYITRIGLKIEEFYDEIRYFLLDTFHLCIWECNPGSYLNYEELPGVWFVHPKYDEEDLCVEIDTQDNYIEHTSDAQQTYSLFFSEIANRISIVDGWSVRDEYSIARYHSSDNFELLSENNHYSYNRMDDLDACMDRKAIGPAIREGITKLKGQFIVEEHAEVRYFTYLNKTDDEILVEVHEDGSFEYQARNVYEDPWITQWSEQMILTVTVVINNQYVRVPTYIDKTSLQLSQEGHVADMGKVSIALTHLQSCVLDTNGALLNGTFPSIINTNYYATYQDIDVKEGKIDLYLGQDQKPQTLYIFDKWLGDERNISLTKFAATQHDVNLTANCSQLTQETLLSQDVLFSKVQDDHSTLKIYSLDRDLKSVVSQEDGQEVLRATLHKNGHYTIALESDKETQTSLKGSVITITVEGETYEVTIEHGTKPYVTALTLFYYEGEVTAIYDGYDRRIY